MRRETLELLGDGERGGYEGRASADVGIEVRVSGVRGQGVCTGSRLPGKICSWRWGQRE